MVVCAAWAFSACLYLLYATLVGSIEEQMYYITLAPCLLALTVWISSTGRAHRVRALTLVGAALVAAALVFDAAVWATVHSRDDNVYASFLRWEPTHIRNGSTIAVTEDVAQFVLTGVTMGQWNTPAELAANQVDYVLVDTTLVSQGYGEATPALVAYLNADARVVFRAHSAQSGSLLLYDTRSLTHSVH
jgi:hypothetical protein